MPATPINVPGADVSVVSPLGITYRTLGLWPDRTETTDYSAAWDLQREIHARVVEGLDRGTVLLLEHDPVYTAGKRTDPADRPVDGTPVIDVDRGGDITYHGPGQLVGYPIVRLPANGIGVVDFVRRLEEALIRTLADLGITAGRVPHRTGVWLGATEGDPARGIAPKPERKIAAIGIRVSRKTTMHGFALNADMDMSWYDRIVPCGIRDAGVTSIAQELGSCPSLAELADLVRPHLDAMLRYEPYEASPDVGEEHAHNPQTAHLRRPAVQATPTGPQVTYGLTV
ncbi:lipoyl(octanoyl) transferase LipB [Raineyella fluvialis]|uniref:Octanoyltransferase n=1 Tax=Raineyella fluvialis TaxID=2662261 RepID=A0A5Q2FGF3_9ACTN|nr:lipoyl(octanoyl) transferase LipB [Raineyella fluvialis]QGF24193.1 lipoyl(octanoyl) transferase LipB [Raineyella fluvialis]